MGIPLASNFDVGSPIPIDSRMVVADIAARDAIASGVRYLGMSVHVIDSGAGVAMNYQLEGGILDANWTEFAGGGGGAASTFSDDIQTGTITLDPLSKYIRVLGDGINPVTAVEGCIAGIDAQELVVVNFTNFELILNHDLHGTDPSYSFYHPSTSDIVLYPNQAAKYVYDLVIDKWLLMGQSDNGFVWGPNLKVGTTTGGDVDFGAFQGIGINVPSLRFQSSDATWYFSGDGSTYYKMGQSFPIIETFTVDITLDSSSEIVLMDATSGVLNVTIPNASTFFGKYTIKKMDSSANPVVITPLGGETIDGQASYPIYDQYVAISLISNGTNWSII